MLKTWFIALRPWSFTASIIPVSLGAALAWNQGCFHPFLFILTLIGGISIHAGTNLINTYGDFISGVDTIDSAPTCPQLVKNILKPRQVKGVGIGFFVFAFVTGMYLVALRGWPILILGLIGIFGGYNYTAGLAYKYKGLGSISVFFLMGPMMVWGSYYVQTGIHDWLAIWIALPVGFLVSCILHANDLRDIEYDKEAGIKTLAIFLGEDPSIPLYYALNTSAFVSLVLLVLAAYLPLLALLPLLLVPQGWQIMQNAKEAGRGNREKLSLLEAGSARFHFKFGLLFVTALLINLAF